MFDLTAYETVRKKYFAEGLMMITIIFNVVSIFFLQELFHISTTRPSLRLMWWKLERLTLIPCPKSTFNP